MVKSVWKSGPLQGLHPEGPCVHSAHAVDPPLYSVSQPPPPWKFLAFFSNVWEFLVQILRAYYTLVSVLDYKFLFNYLQLWRSYAILSATTQFTSSKLQLIE